MGQIRGCVPAGHFFRRLHRFQLLCELSQDCGESRERGELRASLAGRRSRADRQVVVERHSGRILHLGNRRQGWGTL